ncbi:DUF1934 domain-containing protein [Lactobacillus sp. ESL0701]|uniref:DUF1934 domain-containing protein n=1 Tax=Lactobacillus sp. ESL0701 TaxID=2983217 RepID=UPI0023F9358D|nr:DUF1934 domain-containing protein [Lactobacillus sp. ESL0701]MDF7672567.1 DUF1934 domain-containing protein [Lactobacillus sp. ESL0701]
MAKVAVTFTSTIRQEQETESFTKKAVGELRQDGAVTRVSYLEDDKIPVKILIKTGDVIIRRQPDEQNYSQLHFRLGEQQACRYVAAGYQMDLTSTTNQIKFFSKKDGSRELRIEYDLFSGLYLVGNYTVTLIFT